MKDIINLDRKESKATLWASLFFDRNTAAYFDSFETEYIPQKVLHKVKGKFITSNIAYLRKAERLGGRIYVMSHFLK